MTQTSKGRAQAQTVAREAVNFGSQQATAYARDPNLALAYVPENMVGAYRRLGYQLAEVGDVELLAADSRVPAERDIGVFHIDDLGDDVAGLKTPAGTLYLMRGDKHDITARREAKKSLRAPVVAERQGDITARIKASRRNSSGSRDYTGLTDELTDEVSVKG